MGVESLCSTETRGESMRTHWGWKVSQLRRISLENLWTPLSDSPCHRGTLNSCCSRIRIDKYDRQLSFCFLTFTWKFLLEVQSYWGKVCFENIYYWRKLEIEILKSKMNRKLLVFIVRVFNLNLPFRTTNCSPEHSQECRRTSSTVPYTSTLMQTININLLFLTRPPPFIS